ncbi:phosphoribosylformylglycinamidine synthase subunit PurS [Roseisolibacter agri]|uniref:Phosphoribosylformylglycinamidine synthase subunit PurS n=1 Tax=Roseisolibacter agri TaxID=2014610 RepID=A0AA37V822_9BACT|nr:phosphoribosylformylglycinamidine synthase subunit PurS [Roseisolibacter agri]GLC27356.1 phosphoribosylformylglycinamidine synthase subunit PurS [Roseisolibacter agri]
MPAYRIEIRVVPRRGILDPQGKAVADALHSLGFPEVTDVRVGRHVVVETRAASADEAQRRAAEMCERLLANPVTEDFEIEQVVEIAAVSAAAHG